MEATKILWHTSKNSLIKIKEYYLESNNELFYLRVGKSSNEDKIYFYIIPLNNLLLSYESKYSLDNLYQINQSFRFFKSIDELIDAFDTLVKDKKIFIEKNQNDNLYIKLGFLINNFIGKEEKILMDLKKEELSEKEGNKMIFGKIIELEKKLSQKDEEIKSLNDTLNEMKIKYKEIEKRIVEIEKKIIIKINSDILREKRDLDFIEKRLNPENKNISFDLIYKCNENNDTVQKFHAECDGKKNVLVLIETNEGVRFGGFTSVGFNSTSGATLDNNAFLFSIDKKKIYNVKMDQKAIYCGLNYGPVFLGGGSLNNIYIGGKHFLKEICNTCVLKDNHYDIKYDFELNNSKQFFYISNLEIFQVTI